MKKRFFAIILAVLLGISAIAIAEIACPRMGGMMCGRQNESCPMQDGSCPMMNGETCAMQGECTMQNGEACAMQGGSCPMMNGETCAMQGEGCAMDENETCEMNCGGCAMQASSASVPSGMPCARADHALFEGTLPAGYHFTLCEDCTLVTGTDFYLCMSACEICGMHVHAQESEHDCPIISWLLG